MYDLIDFSDFDEPEPLQIKTTSLYKKDYDETTTKFYRVVRERKLNVIMQEDTKFSSDKSFEFSYKWDPYTGERYGKDPYGSLYFHPDDLIHYFHTKRLNRLWEEPKDEINGGYFQGHYDDAVGSGDNIFIESRGCYPELYLFRLPIVDCYLEKNSDPQRITMGPKLTDEEVALIDRIAEENYKNNYRDTYGVKRPSLRLMKVLYDQAISKEPDISKLKNGMYKNTPEHLKELREKANRLAVDALKKL